MGSRKGSSLLEVLIYTAICGLLFTMIYQFFNLGVSYFMAAKASIEVQGGIQTAVHRLVRELSESNLATVRFYPTSSYPSAPYGVVFASPRYMSTHATMGNRLVYDNASPTPSGKPLWHKFVCYYLDQDPSIPGYFCLIRKEKDLPGSGYSLLPIASSDTTQSFRNNTSLPMEKVATNIRSGGFTIYYVSGNPMAVGNPITINFQLESLSKGKKNTLESQLFVNVYN